MPLIINADDFGKSKEVNNAILEAFERGLITRTTLMVNMPYADEAVELAGQNSLKDYVGIHLNLTEGRPLTKAIQANRLICDREGFFHGLFHASVKHRLYMDRKTLNEIYDELKAQLEKYKEYGLTLWHIDSHHHIHTDYPVYRVLKKLSHEYQFSSIRISRNLYLGGNPLMRLYKNLYNRAIRKLCAQTADLFGSYRDYSDFPDTQVNQYKGKTLEIMMHPVYDREGMLVDGDIPMEQEIINWI